MCDFSNNNILHLYSAWLHCISSNYHPFSLIWISNLLILSIRSIGDRTIRSWMERCQFSRNIFPSTWLSQDHFQRHRHDFGIFTPRVSVVWSHPKGLIVAPVVFVAIFHPLIHTSTGRRAIMDYARYPGLRSLIARYLQSQLGHLLRTATQVVVIVGGDDD